MTRPLNNDGATAGFTLIEAMVAMAILAIATAGIIRAAETHIDTLHGLERRTAAQWVAENALAETGAHVPLATGDIAMLGWKWRVTTRQTASDDPDIRQIFIEVRAAGETVPTGTLRGFVDAGTVTP